MILRDDDVFLTHSPTCGRKLHALAQFIDIHEAIVAAGRKHVLGIIAGEIFNHPGMLSYLSKHKGECEFAVHGWLHEPYAQWEEEPIFRSLVLCRDTIEEVFSVKPGWLFAPWNNFTDGIRRAAARAGLRVNESYVGPGAALRGLTADALNFHYWHDQEREEVKQWLVMQPSSRT